MSRQVELLKKAEAALAEVYTLSELMAIGARIVAWGLEHPEQAVAALNGAQLQGAYEALRAGLDKHLTARP